MANHQASTEAASQKPGPFLRRRSLIDAVPRRHLCGVAVGGQKNQHPHLLRDPLQLHRATPEQTPTFWLFFRVEWGNSQLSPEGAGVHHFGWAPGPNKEGQVSSTDLELPGAESPEPSPESCPEPPQSLSGPFRPQSFSWRKAKQKRFKACD